MAQRIIEFREKNGKFKKIQELMKVKGIGEKTFKRFEKMVTI
jgi:competence protein ComEA